MWDNLAMDLPMLDSPAPPPDAAFEPASFTGFTSGRGNVVSGPSEEALARARRLVEHSSPPQSPEQPLVAKRQVSPPAREEDEQVVPKVVGFSSGHGVPFALPKREDLERAERDIFGSQTPGRPALFDTTATPQPAAVDPVAADETTRAPSSPLVPTTVSFAPVAIAQPTPIKSTSTAFHSPMLSRSNSSTATPRAQTPSDPPRFNSFRPPLGPRPSNTPLRNSTPLAAATLALAQSTPKPSTPLTRRLNLGMTPGQRPATLKKFSTPFKGGKRPEGISASTPGKVAGAKVLPGVPQSGTRSEVKKEMFEPVFDLTPKGPRQTLAHSGLRPQSYFLEQLIPLLPADILEMTFHAAEDYLFPSGEGSHDALAAMLKRGCVHLPAERREKWIANHWQLVVWKLASIVRSKPELRESYWSFQAARDQMLYRYEREYNRGERSAIQRIQEQDSPSGVPLVLCVSQVLWDQPASTSDKPAKEGEEKPMVIAGLELTDGWYRVRTTIDETLRSAVSRGKIVEGAKLSIVGARLEANREGTDVLDALGKSSLVISANSSSLAPWHAKLGFGPRPPVATLESLTPGGGAIPLLDIEIESVFPYGYVDLSKKGKGVTWNEEEEKIRARDWERGRDAVLAKMEDAAEKEGEGGEWDEVVDMLREQQIRSGSIPDVSLDDNEEEPDEILDRIECAQHKMAVIAKLAPHQIAGCLALAGERMRQSREQCLVDLQSELADEYPPREVRGFRVVRIRDARPDRKILEKAQARTAQLTVWDAAALGDGFFTVGRRYLVSGVRPKGGWGRRAREVTLASGRDTRWQVLDSKSG